MEKPITDLVQVTPEWLTERLQSNGHLEGSGEVANVHVESSSPGSAIETVHLTVDYHLTRLIYLRASSSKLATLKCARNVKFFFTTILLYVWTPLQLFLVSMLFTIQILGEHICYLRMCLTLITMEVGLSDPLCVPRANKLSIAMPVSMHFGGITLS